MIEHSVLIYSHNHAAFINECVDSVFAQSRPPEEIIVYDDGSRDDSLARLRSYGDRIQLIAGTRDPRSEYLSEATAVQAAFALSRGRVIYLLDGHDRFQPDKIARYAAAFELNPDAAVVQAPVDLIDEHGCSMGTTLEPRYHVTNHLREIYRQHDVNFFYPTSALALSRYYLERIFPLDLTDHLPLWIDARLCIPAAYYGRIVTLPDPLTDLRCNPVADTERLRARPSNLREALLRARLFNTFCRRHQLRPISPWRNRRLYLHLLRYALPAYLFEFCARRLGPAFEWFE